MCSWSNRWGNYGVCGKDHFIFCCDVSVKRCKRPQVCGGAQGAGGAVSPCAQGGDRAAATSHRFVGKTGFCPISCHQFCAHALPGGGSLLALSCLSCTHCYSSLLICELENFLSNLGKSLGFFLHN